MTKKPKKKWKLVPRCYLCDGGIKPKMYLTILPE
jgi:hypothetical protein